MYQILADMEAGLSSAGKRKFISIPDRREAIKTAVSLANSEDIILIAGKGHEKYQDINGIKFPFDDKAILLEMFKELGK
jgi:UDP-N-acetylmuramoyl-L-alanyl-D-glutamate--2,6-diaminopimelate ligase